MPVCEPGSLPGFVDTVTTVAGRGSPAEWAWALRDPLPRRLVASYDEPWRYFRPCVFPLRREDIGDRLRPPSPSGKVVRPGDA